MEQLQKVQPRMMVQRPKELRHSELVWPPESWQ